MLASLLHFSLFFSPSFSFPLLSVCLSFFPYHLNGSSLLSISTHARRLHLFLPFFPRPPPPLLAACSATSRPPFRFAPTSTASDELPPARSTDRPIRYPRGSFSTNPPRFRLVVSFEFPTVSPRPRVKHLRQAFSGNLPSSCRHVTRPRLFNRTA